MATHARITPTLLAWVLLRRKQGAPWKVILNGLREAGLPHSRVLYWREINRDRSREHARRNSQAFRKKHQRTGLPAA